MSRGGIFKFIAVGSVVVAASIFWWRQSGFEDPGASPDRPARASFFAESAARPGPGGTPTVESRQEIAVPAAENRKNLSLEISEILADTSLDNDAVIGRMLEIVRRNDAPEHSRVAAMTHVFNLLGGESYLPVLSSLVETELPGEVFDPVWIDVYERPTSLQAEAAWRIATKDGHSHQESAVELLQKLIGPQADPDPSTWRPAVEALKAGQPQAPNVGG